MATIKTSEAINKVANKVKDGVIPALNLKAKQDLSNVNVGAANSGKTFKVKADGTLELVSLNTADTYTKTETDNSIKGKTELVELQRPDKRKFDSYDYSIIRASFVKYGKVRFEQGLVVYVGRLANSTGSITTGIRFFNQDGNLVSYSIGETLDADYDIYYIP